MADDVADDEGRRRHYGEFYGLPGHDASADGRRTAWVHGNCQAESLRLQLAIQPDDPDLRTVRVPPAHELTAEDLPHLRRLLARTDVLVTQPVRDGYRDLPIGTGELRAGLPPGATTVLVPVIRFAGLYPAHALVRPPHAPGLEPPLVGYHNLRTLARAAGRTRVETLTADRVRAVARRSGHELRTREERHGTVVVSDLFAHPDFAQMRTINHPGNSVWVPVAERVRRRLGLPEDVPDVGRPLLDHVHAPREPAVVEAFGLPDPPRSDWLVDGVELPDEEVREAHLRWYAEHPDVVRAGLERHAATLADLGLSA